MKNPHEGNKRIGERKHQRGFTLTEVLIAIVILLVGIVAVAQLVPASIGSNSANRNDSSALVFAQREMDQFLLQPLNNTSYVETIDTQSFTCNLGDPAQPNVVVGSNVRLFYNYSFVYHDPNDPVELNYDVRWAVILTTNNGVISSKRFIMGVRKKGGNGFYNPVTLDTIIYK
jgi:prepilin-type N-terminal cleavage/methylation domain-containing protein